MSPLHFQKHGDNHRKLSHLSFSQHYQPRSEHRRETVTHFVTARTPNIVGTNHLPCKLIYRFFQSLWPGHYFGLSLGFLERDLIDGHMALHNTNLYGTLIRSYSLGCCSQNSVEASGLNLFILFKWGMFAIWAIVRLEDYYCLLLGHLGLYIFVAIWAIARPANNYYYMIFRFVVCLPFWACKYLLPSGPLHGRQILLLCNIILIVFELGAAVPRALI